LRIEVAAPAGSMKRFPTQPLASEKHVYLLCNKLHAGGAEKQLFLTAKALSELGLTCQIRTLASPEPGASLRSIASDLADQFGVHPARFSLAELLKMRNRSQMYWSWGRRADLTLKLLMPFVRGRLCCSLRDADLHKMRRYRILERAFHHRVDCFISNSLRASHELSLVVPRVEERSVILLNALPESPSMPTVERQTTGKLSVAMLGNILIYKKGYDILLELGELIVQNGLDIVINVAGRDESNGLFERLIHSKSLSGVIQYKGPTASPLEFLASHDVYLLLSRYEGVPNALVEAMSLGLPSIATNVGDISLLFQDGEHLQILQTGNPGEAYDALTRFKQNRKWATDLGLRGREYALERFSFKRLKSDLACLFGLSDASDGRTEPVRNGVCA
jgi:glycosyltransferase involved in cell wall biosynthesis